MAYFFGMKYLIALLMIIGKQSSWLNHRIQLTFIISMVSFMAFSQDRVVNIGVVTDCPNPNAQQFANLILNEARLLL